MGANQRHELRLDLLRVDAVPRLALVTSAILGTLVLVPLFYLVALFVAHDVSADFLDIDRCLDRGGRWEYERRVCDP